jgi:beta-N-acetylhexosaminidase
MRDEQLAARPFNLDAAAIAWVRATFARLTTDDKIRQLFTLNSMGLDAATLEAQQQFRPGGITRRHSPDLAAERAILEAFDAAAPVPLIVSGDLEGSRMSLPFGTELPNPLALAALDDIAVTREVARIQAIEAKAIGVNWTFTPLLDVNAAFRSAIVATRGFGSDVATIERHAMATLEAFQAEGVAASVKHWPGEGFDDRDQHMVTTVNPLSMEDWEKSFGRLYRSAIAAGAMSVMSAHIALPAWVRRNDPDAGVEAYRPASLSHLLNEELLRQHLGFNGVIVSDATSMAGLGAWGPRSQTLPEVIANGSDVILFVNDAETDYGYIRDAVEDGRITAGRLDEAVLRQLALKAAVGLNRPRQYDASALAQPSNRAFAEAAVRRMPTLVKDTQSLLPLSVEKHRRVLVVTPGIVNPWMPQPIPFALPSMLAEHGFEVSAYAPDMVVDRKSFDLVLYLFGDETLMTRGRIFADWHRLQGGPVGAMQRFWNDVPTAMISFGYPYMLYDAPRVPTYINAYCTTDTMQRAVVEALLGKHRWNTRSPVDPFAGDEQARY